MIWIISNAMKLEFRLTKLPSARALCFRPDTCQFRVLQHQGVAATSRDEPDMEMAAVGVVEFG